MKKIAMFVAGCLSAAVFTAALPAAPAKAAGSTASQLEELLSQKKKNKNFKKKKNKNKKKKNWRKNRRDDHYFGLNN